MVPFAQPILFTSLKVKEHNKERENSWLAENIGCFFLKQYLCRYFRDYESCMQCFSQRDRGQPRDGCFHPNAQSTYSEWLERKDKKKSLWLVSSTLSCFESQSCVRVRLHVCVCWDERTHTANTFVRRWSSIWSLSTWAALSLKHTRASTPASAPLHVHQYTNICCQGWSFYFFNSCGLHLKKGQGCPAPFPGEVF